MKGFRVLLVGLLLGGVLGWASGYLRFPMMEENNSFLGGLVVGLLLAGLVLNLLFVFNKYAFLRKLTGKHGADGSPPSRLKIHTLIWVLVCVVIILGGAGILVRSHYQNSLLKVQLELQKVHFQQQFEIMEANRQGDKVGMMNKLLEEVEAEIATSLPDGLSDQTIERIAGLCHSFKPYRYFEGDSLAITQLSPERGQLLLALVLMRMDSLSFGKIKSATSFAHADLEGTNLESVDLSGIDLGHANLKNSMLNEANLINANLNNANLWGAKMNRAQFQGANLEWADLRWAELNQADLNLANLDGANLSDAKLLSANLQNATFQYGIAQGAMFLEADLGSSDLLYSDLTKANFNKANLAESNLSRVYLTEAILTQTRLSNISVNKEDWFDRINGMNIVGVKGLDGQFKIVKDTTGRWKFGKFKLEPVNN